jgi:hypothetical protein
MKRYVVSLMMILVASLASAQINSGQLKIKTNGGVGGDTAKAIGIQVYRATSAPSSPATGQLWCDTTTSPCQMKTYNGSAWEAYVDVSIPIQDDLTSFPASPSDGQVFFARNPPQLYVYDATNAKWFTTPMPSYQTGANIIDTFAGSTITAPGSGMTIADGGAGGSMAAGAHSCKVTFSNSTGGETTMSVATASVTFTASHKITYSVIPTGGTGTTQRRIYCSKAAQDLTGPWYWIYTVNDNSTTTVTADNGLADASLLRLGPQSNYSAPLNARWTVENKTASTTSGGCGSTGSAMACSSSNSANPTFASATTDPTVRSSVSLASYSAGDYTIQYRVKVANVTATDTGAVTPCIGTARVGTGDTAIAFSICMGYATIGWTSPMGSSNAVPAARTSRSSVGGSHGASATAFAPWPRTTTFMWVRWVKKGNYANFFTSANGRDWNVLLNTVNTVTEASIAFDVTTNNPTQYELEMAQSNATAYTYVEIDQFSLTVN